MISFPIMGKFIEKSGLSLAGTSTAYLRYLRARNRSPETLASYRDTLDKLAASIYDDLARLNRHDVESWLDGLWATMKPSSVQHHHKNLRAFLNWCVGQGTIPESPMAGIPEPRIKPAVVEPFSHEQCLALYAAARRIRDRALVALLLNTGIRISELCGLRPKDVHEGRLRIMGKGGKQRWVGVSDGTEKLVRTQAMKGKPTVFGVGRHAAYWAVRRLGDRAGVPNAHPHRFRDTFACRFLENGGNIDDLQVILGHSNITMTLRYVQFGRAQRAIQGQMRYAPRLC